MIPSSVLVWTHEHDRKRLPWPGSLSVMTDWHGVPLGIIETKAIEAVPFDDIGRTADRRMPVYCEQFELVFRAQ